MLNHSLGWLVCFTGVIAFFFFTHKIPIIQEEVPVLNSYWVPLLVRKLCLVLLFCTLCVLSLSVNVPVCLTDRPSCSGRTWSHTASSASMQCVWTHCSCVSVSAHVYSLTDAHTCISDLQKSKTFTVASLHLFEDENVQKVIWCFGQKYKERDHFTVSTMLQSCHTWNVINQSITADISVLHFSMWICSLTCSCFLLLFAPLHYGSRWGPGEERWHTDETFPHVSRLAQDSGKRGSEPQEITSCAASVRRQRIALLLLLARML